MKEACESVVGELAKAVSADPAVLLKAARSVVAEELAKVKQGFEAAPLDVLVKRARLQLERDGEATPVSDPAPPPMLVFPARPAPSREALEISAPIDAPPKAAPEPKPQPAPAPKPQPELELDFAPPPPAGPERFFLRAPTPLARHEPAVKSMSEMPPRLEIFEDHDSTQLAMEEFRFKAAERPAPAPARSSRKGWLVALVSVLAIGAGLTWAVREYVFRGEIVRSVAPAARKKPDVAPPASAAPVPAPTAAPALVAKPAAPSPKAIPVPTVQAAAGPPSGAAVPKGRAAVLLTPDWAGKPVVYVIHFSSHKDRESATKEAQKLGAALGAPEHAVEVDLGEKGIWYRVVIGEFADVDSARAFRADLEAKKTPGMGFVYEMRGR